MGQGQEVHARRLIQQSMATVRIARVLIHFYSFYDQLLLRITLTTVFKITVPKSKPVPESHSVNDVLLSTL